MDAPVRFLFLKYAAETPAEFQYDWIAELRGFLPQFRNAIFRRFVQKDTAAACG